MAVSEMKVFNHTKIPDELLKPILYRSAKAVGSIRTQKVVIKITTSQYSYSGHVKPCRIMAYRLWYLEGRYSDKPSKQIMLRSDGGYMFLRIPVNRFTQDPIAFAENVFNLASHEWQHIKDLQKNNRFGEYNRNWRNRPHERRAITAAKRADRVKDKNEFIQDSILNLALFMEDVWKEKKAEWDKKVEEAKERARKRLEESVK